MLQKQCKLTCSEDNAFAKKRVVAKRNRYKDKFPCELRMLIKACCHQLFLRQCGSVHNILYVITGLQLLL